MNIPPILTAPRAIDTFHRALRGQLTLEENVSCTRVDVPDTGTADVEFEVQHGLGRVPRHYLWNADVAGSVYDSRRTEWTELLMYLKCSASNAQLTLTIL